MKKLSLILLMAVLALPMLAQSTAATKASEQRQALGRVQNNTFKAIESFNWTLLPAAQTRGDVLYEWDFEDDADFEGWATIDADGDDESWVIDESNGHNGPTCLLSYSWNGTALNPDNWLISPQVPLGGVLTLWAMNYSSSYRDHVTVWVCVGEPTTTEDFVQVSDAINPSNSWTEFTVDLAAYAGKTGCFAIRHSDCYDLYRIYIDDISLTASAAVMPENVTVNPGTTTADVAWEDAENVAWNLKYREIRPGSENNLLWDFEEDTNDNNNTELTGGWTTIDADGDGYEWYHLYGSFNNHSGKGHVTSASYQGSPLTPDNWLVSPEVKLDGKLSFWAAGQDPSYAEEVFAVYVNVGGDPTNTADFELISDAELVASGEMTEFVFDLSGYEGAMGYVAIRHYNVTDMFRLNVDDIAITYVEPAEWITVEGVGNPYTIEGLTPETTYEVQVQGVNEEDAVSLWTESVTFITLAEPVVTIPDVHILGQINDQNWAPNAGTKMAYNEETKLYTATVNLDANETFGFTTELAENDDAWDYIEPFRFGPESNGDFWLTEEWMGKNLSLTFDNYGAIKVLETGEYNITVDLENNIIVVDKVPVEPEFIRGDVNDDKSVNISDVTVLINYLLSHNEEGVNLPAADCNLDTVINISDVTVLINFLLSHSWPE